MAARARNYAHFETHGTLACAESHGKRHCNENDKRETRQVP